MNEEIKFKYLDGDVAQIVDSNLDLEVIEVPDLKSLYLPSEELDGFIQKLEIAVSNTSKSDKKIVLKVLGSRADDLNEFVSYNPTYLRIDVVEHLDNLRKLFKRIYDQSYRFVLVTDGDLLGSWFELSLMCHRVIVLNHLSRIGFSQLAYGFLPALGAIEILNYFAKGVTKSLWEKGFLWNALDVPEKLPFEVVPIGSSDISTQNLIGFKAEIKGLTRSLRSSRSLPYRGDWASTKELRRKYAEVLWESFWSKSGENESFRFIDLDLVLSSWFEASEHSALSYSASSLYGSSNGKNLSFGHIEKIWIDVTHYLPPLKLIVLWAQTDVNIAFYCEDSYKLILSIKRIYEKLSSNLEKDEFRKIWDDNISWFVSDVRQKPSKNKNILKFISDGSVECVGEEFDYRVVRLATNDFRSKIGTAELALSDSDFNDPDIDEKIWTNGFVFRNLIKTKSLDVLGMPSCQWIRACFLEELAKEASNMKGGFKDPFKWLAGDGWGIVADESWWGAHVISRFSKWPIENGAEIFENIGPKEEFRNIASWNQILKLVKIENYELHGGSLSPQRTVDTLFSEHMLIFSTLLGLKLLEFNVVANVVHVDIIVRFSLEVPKRYGSPVGFIKRLGEDLIQEYADTYFPNYNFKSALKRIFEANT